MAGAPEAEEVPAMSNASTQAVETSEFGTQAGEPLPREPPIEPRALPRADVVIPEAPVTRAGEELSDAQRLSMRNIPVVTPQRAVHARLPRWTRGAILSARLPQNRY
jgi:hypothetical protein